VPHAIRATEDLLFSGAESCGPVTSLVRLSFSRWAASICCWAAARVSCSCLSRSTRFSGASVVVARFRHGVFVRRLQQGLSSGFFQAPVGPALPFDFFLLPPSGAGHRFLLFGSVWWLQFLLFDLEGARANESSL
jgi:hypothetical protein